MCGGISVLTSHFKYWAAFSIVAITAVSLAWWDSSDVLHSSLALIAAITGMAYTLLAGRGQIACFAFGFINAPLYAYLSWHWGYYGDMALNLYYFVMMFPGYVCWKRHIRQNTFGDIVKTRLSTKERWIWALIISAVLPATWAALSALGGNRPLCDALTNVLSVAAIILTVKRCIEQWVMWIAVDAIEVVMWFRVDAASYALLAMWLLFLADGIYLFKLWIDDMRADIRIGKAHMV